MRWRTVYYCSIEYWFRCMDLDGDGMISMYEMEYCLLLLYRVLVQMYGPGWGLSDFHV